MAAFGQRLKTEREARGVSLAEVAAATKISPAALEALERNEVQRLPGGIFGRAMVRSYALTVGLDPEATVNEFLAEIARLDRERARTIRPPEITTDDRLFLERQRQALRLLRTALIVLVIAGAVAAAWLLWGRQFVADRPAGPAITPPPTAAAPPPPAPVTQPIAPPAAPPPSTPPPDPIATLVVEFELTDACWVRITADGESRVDGLLQPGSRREVRGAKTIYVSLGNAGAFQWWINGKPAKLLGPSGSTRRATITVENLATFLQ